MDINYEILENLLKCNKNIKLTLHTDSKILNIYSYNQSLGSLILETNSIYDNSEVIYNYLINLDGVTLYIPKIYINSNS